MVVVIRCCRGGVSRCGVCDPSRPVHGTSVVVVDVVSNCECYFCCYDDDSTCCWC